MKVHDLKPADGSRKRRKRVGRGISGKGGKTAGRGTKGQKARDTIPVSFEGGQLPLSMRIPKLRGFNNPFRVEYQAVNLDTIEASGLDEVTPDTLGTYQLLELIASLLHGRRPSFPEHSVCIECKQRGTVCVMVAHGTACLGPVTQAGCRAICPSFTRGCYGCFGPMETPNTASLAAQWTTLGVAPDAQVRALRTFNAWAEPFREAGERIIHEERRQ